MNIGWIYPHRLRCGITKYSLDYMETLRKAVDIVDIDPRWWLADRRRFMSEIERCSILHVQYDTTAFMCRGNDRFGAMLRSAGRPVVVTLHEVYEKDPFVFPRCGIRGSFPLLHIKRFLWDLRHPVQRAFEHHLQASFYAKKIIVHHRYQAKILISKGIMESAISIIPMPVRLTAPVKRFVFPSLPLLRIAAVGFINPTFDYELLICVLERIRRPWLFTWIGGIRNAEQQKLLDEIRRRIRDRGWEDRFTVSGWVDDIEMSSLLEASDIILALFKSRSSSGSLSRCMGACKPIIASDIPLTREIASVTGPNPPLLLTRADPQNIVALIEELIANEGLQRNILEGLSAYIDSAAIERTTEEHVRLYREEIAQ